MAGQHSIAFEKFGTLVVDYLSIRNTAYSIQHADVLCTTLPTGHIELPVWLRTGADCEWFVSSIKHQRFSWIYILRFCDSEFSVSVSLRSDILGGGYGHGMERSRSQPLFSSATGEERERERERERTL